MINNYLTSRSEKHSQKVTQYKEMIKARREAEKKAA